MKTHYLSSLILAAATLAVHAGTLTGVRSVRITNTRNDWFYIEELRILNDQNKDLASVGFGTTATASENPAFGGIVDGPIDDDMQNCCTSGFHSSTSRGKQSYTMTFPSPQTVTGKITVWNRQDGCCAQRLDGMLFEFFSGEDATGTLIAAAQVDNLATENSEISGPDGASFDVPSADKDTDGDGLADRYESANGLDPNSKEGDNGAAGDPDKDGSPNIEEMKRETDPKNPDTDGDGASDGSETGTGKWVSASDRGTNPKVPDTDGDGLLDGPETNTGKFVNATNTGTDPHKKDTDGDGFADQREVKFGSDPTKAESFPKLEPVISGVRSVRVTNTQASWFYVEELEILNTKATDVASLDFGTTATASEAPGFGGKAEGPIDDIFGNCCANGFHSSTETGDQWIVFSFPSPQDLSQEVRVWNRQDGCCASRLDAMKFEFFSGPEASGNLIATQEVLNLASENPDISTPEGAAFSLVKAGPAAPTAPFQITAISLDRVSGKTSLSWTSKAGESYDIQTSSSLAPNQWLVASAKVPATGASTSATVNASAELARAFYRVVKSQ